jgi:ectoine hydroxylase-related dioxygenase (phytanoyl-CoA dioxygenase family)
VSPSFAVEPLVDARGVLDDPEALRASAAEHGYVFVADALDPAPILALRAAILARCAERGWLAPGSEPRDGIARSGVRLGEPDAQWIALQADVIVLREVDALRHDPCVCGILEALFSGAPPVSGRGDIVRITSPAAVDLTTPPHRDGDYLRDENLWTAWIPLGDCPLELGGLAVLPGSHRTSETNGVWTSTDYAPGDVLLFGSRTLHRAGENRSGDRLRLSVDFRYVPSP